MKAAKYVMFTDHTAAHNNEDAFTRLNATDILEAMNEVIDRTSEDENLYVVTIYELCKNTNSKYYKPILKNFHHSGFVPVNNCPFLLYRATYKDDERFEIVTK